MKIRETATRILQSFILTFIITMMTKCRMDCANDVVWSAAPSWVTVPRYHTMSQSSYTHSSADPDDMTAPQRG